MKIRRGHGCPETLYRIAAPTSRRGGHLAPDTPLRRATRRARNGDGDQTGVGAHSMPIAVSGNGVERDHENGETQTTAVPLPADLVARYESIAHEGRRYMALQKTRIAVTNALKALERRGMSLEDLYAMAGARALDFVAAIEEGEKHYAKRLAAETKRLPFARVVEQTDGLDYLGLGKILAFTGSLINFPSPAHLWSYCGLAVKDGKAPRSQRGVKTGYNRFLKSICVGQIGAAIVRGKKGQYRAVYDARRAAVLARPRLGPSECPFSKEPHYAYERLKDAHGWNRKTGKAKAIPCVKVDADGEIHSAHVFYDAVRVAVKVLLKDLWIEAWRVEGKGQHGRENLVSAARGDGHGADVLQKTVAVAAPSPR